MLKYYILHPYWKNVWSYTSILPYFFMAWCLTNLRIWATGPYPESVEFSPHRPILFL